MMRTMPNGRQTDDLEQYLAAWDELKQPLERVFGFTTVGYDPGLLVRDNDTGDVFEISIDLALKLKELSKNRLQMALGVLGAEWAELWSSKNTSEDNTAWYDGFEYAIRVLKNTINVKTS